MVIQDIDSKQISWIYKIRTLIFYFDCFFPPLPGNFLQKLFWFFISSWIPLSIPFGEDIYYVNGINNVY